MAVYWRNGRLIFWAVNKRLVLEIRLPIFIWKTNSRNRSILGNGKASLVSRGWLSRFLIQREKVAPVRLFYHFLAASPANRETQKSH